MAANQVDEESLMPRNWLIMNKLYIGIEGTIATLAWSIEPVKSVRQ